MIVLSFQRIAGEINTTRDNRDSFSHYFVPILRIKHFNVLIDGEKNEEEAYEKIIETSNNNDYTTGNLLDFAYFEKNYRLIAIDLSKQTKLKDSQQINFIGGLLNIHGATMFFIIKRSEEIILNFAQNVVRIL